MTAIKNWEKHHQDYYNTVTNTELLNSQKIALGRICLYLTQKYFFYMKSRFSNIFTLFWFLCNLTALKNLCKYNKKCNQFVERQGFGKES